MLSTKYFTLMADSSNRAPHILSTSATLFGLCYVVFTSLKAFKLDAKTLMDEFTAFAMVLFLTSCIFSFFSMKITRRSDSFEKIADYMFLTGLLTLFSITIFIVFDIVQ
jgi:predicted membrane channel-forming protein YqfA (hemolysin III family)